MLKSARLERKTLTDIAQEELRQAITGGTFQPGGQLPTEADWRRASGRRGLSTTERQRLAGMQGRAGRLGAAG